jgi:hypothetical protein
MALVGLTVRYPARPVHLTVKDTAARLALPASDALADQDAVRPAVDCLVQYPEVVHDSRPSASVDAPVARDVPECQGAPLCQARLRQDALPRVVRPYLVWLLDRALAPDVALGYVELGFRPPAVEPEPGSQWSPPQPRLARKSAQRAVQREQEVELGSPPARSQVAHSAQVSALREL